MPTAKKTKTTKSTKTAKSVKSTAGKKQTARRATTTIKRGAIKSTVRVVAKPAVNLASPKPMIDPVAAVKNFWTGYFDVTGRSTRSEFWFGILFAFVLDFLCAFFIGGIIAVAVRILLILPLITLTMRRFRDAGVSVWWYLVPALLFSVPPIVGGPAWYYIADVAPVTLWMRIYAICFLVFIIFGFCIVCMPSKK